MLQQLIIDMYDLGMIKFGEFTLKSGKSSLIYADVRTAISYPKIFRQICDLIYDKVENLDYDFICGVPYSALTFASGIAYAHNVPMLLKRKEAKGYGTKKILEGDYQAGQRVVIIEDVVTTGMSIGETTSVLEEADLEIDDVITFLDREQGGREKLKQSGYKLHSIINLTQVVDILYAAGKISAQNKQDALAMISE